MKIKAIIEKGKDGLYSVYSTQHLGNSYLGGFGDSVSAAKADFFESIREAYGEQGIPFTPEEIDVEYRYDVPSFFNFFDIINVRRAYKCGVAYPGEKTTEKIFRAIKKLATELSVASL